MTRAVAPSAPLSVLPRRSTDSIHQLAARIALLFLEAESGRRPLRQLRGLVAPALYQRLLRSDRHRSQPRARSMAPAAHAVRAVFAQRLEDDVFEASVIVDRTTRVTALALRLERHRGRWRVVELTAPEDGVPAHQTASVAAAAP